MTERQPQYCHGCRQIDAHPRHLVLEADGAVTARHMDCCRDAGCVDQSCDRILAEAGGKRGDELIAALPEITARLAEAEDE